MAKQYLVWSESDGLLSGPHSGRAAAESAVRRWRRACLCGTDGLESHPGKGDFACGVLSPHGIHIQVTDGDRDVTGE